MMIPSVFASLAVLVARPKVGDDCSPQATQARAIGMVAIALHSRAERIGNRWAPHAWRDSRLAEIRDAAMILADCAEKLAKSPRGYHPLVITAAVGDSVNFAAYFVADPDGDVSKVSRGKTVRGFWRTTTDSALHAKRLGVGPYVVTETEEVESGDSVTVMVTVQASNGRSATLPCRSFAVVGTTEQDSTEEEMDEAAE